MGNKPAALVMSRQGAGESPACADGEAGSCQAPRLLAIGCRSNLVSRCGPCCSVTGSLKGVRSRKIGGLRGNPPTCCTRSRTRVFVQEQAALLSQPGAAFHPYVALLSGIETASLQSTRRLNQGGNKLTTLQKHRGRNANTLEDVTARARATGVSGPGAVPTFERTDSQRLPPEVDSSG
jgi:hypothetical protein